MDMPVFDLGKLIDPGTISGAFILALFVLILASIAANVTTRIIRRSKWVMGRLERRVDPTVIRYILRFKNLAIYLIAGVVYGSLVPGLRALLGTMMAGAGITAIVVGFAAKSTLANLVSGLSLAIYRPFRIGDKVSLEGEYGTIEDITLRHTIVRTWENKRLIIPNEKLDSMSLVNYSIIDKKILCRVEMGVSYDTDIDLVRKIALEEAMKCPFRDESAEEPWMRIISHGDFSIGFRVYLWVPDIDGSWSTRFWILENIKKRFDKEGIEIPFPYRTVVYKKDLPEPKRLEPDQDE